MFDTDVRMSEAPSRQPSVPAEASKQQATEPTPSALAVADRPDQPGVQTVPSQEASTVANGHSQPYVDGQQPHAASNGLRNFPSSGMQPELQD